MCKQGDKSILFLISKRNVMIVLFVVSSHTLLPSSYGKEWFSNQTQEDEFQIWKGALSTHFGYERTFWPQSSKHSSCQSATLTNPCKPI